MIEKMKNWIKQHFNGKQNKRRTYMLLIAAAGLMIILFSNVFSNFKKMPEINQQNMNHMDTDDEIEEVALLKNVSEIESNYEADLKSMLNQIKGVSEVEIMVNVDSTNVQVYEKDLIVGAQTTDETDKNGGTRNVEDETKETKLVYVRQGDEEVPVLVQTKKPEVRGVFITAKGAENIDTKKWIIESVSKVLDVPTYRISVMPK